MCFFSYLFDWVTPVVSVRRSTEQFKPELLLVSNFARSWHCYACIVVSVLPWSLLLKAKALYYSSQSSQYICSIFGCNYLEKASFLSLTVSLRTSMPANVRVLSVKENLSHHLTARSCAYQAGRLHTLLTLRISVGKIPALPSFIYDNVGLEWGQEKGAECIFL